jgi:short-subunit dehydrogenase
MSKTVVITGASSGAGRAIALAFARKRESLVLSSRNLAALQEVADECRELGANVTIMACDVTEPGAMINLAGAASEVSGSIDV